MSEWKRTATVRIRRGDGWSVKPEADLIDGRTHVFTRGWVMTEDDTSIYVGETAWLPEPAGWPVGAPVGWIACGDLEFAPSPTAGE